MIATLCVSRYHNYVAIQQKGRVNRLHNECAPYDFLELKDLAHLPGAGTIVALATQFIQAQTGWPPHRIGAAVSFCGATIGILFFTSPQPWYVAVGNVLIRTFELYFYAAGGVAAVGALVRKYGPKPVVSESVPKHEFWKPWF